jgi:hypothetical protein
MRPKVLYTRVDFENWDLIVQCSDGALLRLALTRGVATRLVAQLCCHLWTLEQRKPAPD